MLQTPPILLEICAGTYSAALAAARAGAQRIELCSALSEGGLTPSAGLMRAAIELPDIRKHVLIRPRCGDFYYSREEQDIIVDDIRLAREYGADGVVVGALDADGNVDEEAMARFMEAAGTLSVTFHRAFDLCRCPDEALDVLIRLGVPRLLTSGCAATAAEGVENIAAMVRRAAGRLIVIPASGVNAGNVASIIRHTGTFEIHASASADHPSKMKYRHQGVSMGGGCQDEYTVRESDEGLIGNILSALREV